MSDIFSKIVTAVRSGAREIGESIVDANTIRICEQEIEDAKANLTNAKKNLAEVIAKNIQCEREIQRINQGIESNESRAVEALNQGNESLAQELAEKVVELDQELATQQAVKTEHSAHITRLKDLMKKAEHIILEHERELTMVKTAQSVQKATRSISQSYVSGTTKLLDAKSTLERIKQRQQTIADRWSAEEILEKELSGSASNQIHKPVDTGDTSSLKQAILERIRQRAGK
jgi:phage shock protein A